jgi:hypothetical protein
MPFRAFKNNLYFARYGHMWLYSVVAREASREAKCREFKSHGTRSVTILREKYRDLRRRVAG